jgi:hypothetical protein
LSQSIVLDKNFGINGKLKVKKGFNHQLFYDQNDRFFYLTYGERKNDKFSGKFSYYTDGIYKYNVKTGKLIDSFGKKGHSQHELISIIPRSSCSRYWQNTKQNLVCFNQDIMEKEILLFDKNNGSIKTIPRPENQICYFSSFLYHDLTNNRFLITKDQKLFWYNHSGEEFLVNTENTLQKETSSLSYYFVDSSQDSLIILANEFDIKSDSTLIIGKLINVKDFKTELLDTLNFPSNTYFKRISENRLVSLNLEDENIKFKANAFDRNEKHYVLQYLLNENQNINYFDEDNGVIFGLDTKRTFYKPIKDENILSTKSTNYTLIKTNLKSKKIYKYSLSDFFNTEMSIKQILYIGDDSFIILTNENKRKKKKYYLYKFRLN